MPKKGNKGEWSELYAFLKLLVDKKVYGADENLQIMESLHYPIRKIFRKEGEEVKEYDVTMDDSKIKIITEEKEKVYNSDKIKKVINKIFSEIKEGNGASFQVDSAEEIMKALDCKNLKASSYDKADIVLLIHDMETKTNQKDGFSIKSKVGRPSTLLNASKSTNFEFIIEGCDDNFMNRINSIEGRGSIMEKTKEIMENKNIKFNSVHSETFEDNLTMIDSSMPEILSNLLLSYYGERNKKIDKAIKELFEKEIVDKLTMNYKHYSHKVKRLLFAIALGMVPNTEWKGKLQAHGGYLIVREDGEVVCYHVYNLEQFKEYLYRHTRFETASTSRHDFGYIYKDEGKYYYKLNLQIRFTH